MIQAAQASEALGWGLDLQLGLALEAAFEGGERVDLVGTDGQACRVRIAATAGLHELEDDCRGLGGDGDELFQPRRQLQLAVLDLEALRLHHPEELLDHPALLVPSDDLPGVSRTGERMGGQEQPMQGLDTVGCVRFDDLDPTEPNPVGQPFFAPILRPPDRRLAEAQAQRCLPSRTVGALAQLDRLGVAEPNCLYDITQFRAADECMVMHDARQKIEALVGQARPHDKEVALLRDLANERWRFGDRRLRRAGAPLG